MNTIKRLHTKDSIKMADKYIEYSKSQMAMAGKINSIKPLSDKEKEELKLRIALAIGEGISKA